MVKNPLANAGDVRLIPASGRSPGEGNATHSRFLACRIPWTEEPGGRIVVRKHTHTHARVHHMVQIITLEKAMRSVYLYVLYMLFYFTPTII